MPNTHKSFDQHSKLQIKLAIYYKIMSNFTWLVCSKIGGYFKILEWTLYRKEHQHRDTENSQGWFGSGYILTFQVSNFCTAILERIQWLFFPSVSSDQLW